MKRAVIILVKLAVAAALIGYLLQSGNIDLSRLAGIRGWGWLILAQFFVLLMLGLTFYRWHLLLQAQGIRYRLAESFSLSWIGFFFSQFVPGSTGGDLIKAYYVAVEQPELRAAGITTVIIDRLIGLIVFMATGGIAILFNWPLIEHDAHLKFLSGVVAATLLGSLLFAAFIFSDRLRGSFWFRASLRRLPFQRAIRSVGAAVVAYKRQTRVVLIAAGLSVGVQASTVIMTLCYARALGEERVTLLSLFFLVPIALLIMAIPINPPGGLGVGEWAYSHLFRHMGYAHGGLIALIQRINWYAWALVGLIFYLRKRKKIQQAIALGESAPAAVTVESL